MFVINKDHQTYRYLIEQVGAFIEEVVRTHLGEKITQIKLVRAKFGFSLRSAKDLVEGDSIKEVLERELAAPTVPVQEKRRVLLEYRGTYVELDEEAEETIRDWVQQTQGIYEASLMKSWHRD